MINTNWGWGKFWVDRRAHRLRRDIRHRHRRAVAAREEGHVSAEQNGPEHPTTLALIDRILLIARVDVAVLLLVIADMVTKPFS